MDRCTFYRPGSTFGGWEFSTHAHATVVILAGGTVTCSDQTRKNARFVDYFVMLGGVLELGCAGPQSELYFEGDGIGLNGSDKYFSIDENGIPVVLSSTDDDDSNPFGNGVVRCAGDGGIGVGGDGVRHCPAKGCSPGTTPTANSDTTTAATKTERESDARPGLKVSTIGAKATTTFAAATPTYTTTPPVTTPTAAPAATATDTVLLPLASTTHPPFDAKFNVAVDNPAQEISNIETQTDGSGNDIEELVADKPQSDVIIAVVVMAVLVALVAAGAPYLIRKKPGPAPPQQQQHSSQTTYNESFDPQSTSSAEKASDNEYLEPSALQPAKYDCLTEATTSNSNSQFEVVEEASVGLRAGGRTRPASYLEPNKDQPDKYDVARPANHPRVPIRTSAGSAAPLNLLPAENEYAVAELSVDNEYQYAAVKYEVADNTNC